VLNSPVPLARLPPDQPVALQAVRDGGDEGGVATHAVRELLHGHRVIELEEREQVRGSDAEAIGDRVADGGSPLHHAGQRVEDLARLLLTYSHDKPNR
jgi:hypothetical protein